LESGATSEEIMQTFKAMAGRVRSSKGLFRIQGQVWGCACRAVYNSRSGAVCRLMHI